jgi:hypothetical protein
MGVEYHIVNYTKREFIMFEYVDTYSPGEILRNPVATCITTWYFMFNRHDKVAFVSDSLTEWPFSDGTPSDMFSYREVTSEIINTLIAEGIIVDEGKKILDETDPDMYVRILRLA